eukprot:1159918-Pelagomonas_calceolata.AAC.5
MTEGGTGCVCMGGWWMCVYGSLHCCRSQHACAAWVVAHVSPVHFLLVFELNGGVLAALPAPSFSSVDSLVHKSFETPLPHCEPSCCASLICIDIHVILLTWWVGVRAEACTAAGFNKCTAPSTSPTAVRFIRHTAPSTSPVAIEFNRCTSTSTSPAALPNACQQTAHPHSIGSVPLIAP